PSSPRAGEWKLRSLSLDEPHIDQWLEASSDDDSSADDDGVNPFTPTADGEGNDAEKEAHAADPKRQGPRSLGLLQYPSAHSGSAVWRAAKHEREETRAAAAHVQRVLTPLLFPVRVLPQHVPRATEIQSFLSRIEYIEINTVVEREDDVVYYVLDVFRYRQQNGIPTRLRSAAAAPLSSAALQPKRPPTPARSGSGQSVRAPDYQIEHRFSSFARLRSNVLQIARKRHRRGDSCAYCSALVAFFLESDAQPDLRAKFKTNTEARKRILSQFANALLVATRDNHVLCSRSMRGYHQIPVLMKRFFSEQTGENFFS
ncbi:hypothetical protein PybrP1_008326, partial [[Pythium] brassicae (nom. inval.)]